MNFLRFIINRYKGVLSFSFFKYFEVGLTSFTTFILAKKVLPTQMGLAMPIFLYITYANYLSLGMNQVILKNYSEIEKNRESESFFKLNIQLLLIIVGVNFSLAIFFLNWPLSILAALISTGNLFRSYFMAYFRVKNKLKVLNRNNLVYALLLFLLTLLYVENTTDYFLSWAISILMASILYFASDFNFYSQLIKRIFNKPQRAQLDFVLSEGIKLSLTGLIATLLLTSDRLIFNNLNFSGELKGSYQLADFIGTAFYILVTTIIFYFYPKIISQLKNNEIFKKKYISYYYVGIKIFPLVLLICYLGSLIISNFIFPNYPDLEILILGSISIKYSLILLTSISTLFVAKNLEVFYISKTLILIGIIFLLFLFLKLNNIIPFYIIPYLISLFIFIFSLYLLNLYGKNEANS